MFRYSLFFAGLVLAALLAARHQPYLSAVIIYELLMAAALFSGFFAFAINEWKPPRGTSLWPYIAFAAFPALGQMAFARLAPGMFWFAPACFAGLAVYLWRRGVLLVPNLHPKLDVPAGAYHLAVYVLLPVLLWDFRQYFAVAGLWLLVVWLLRSV